MTVFAKCYFILWATYFPQLFYKTHAMTTNIDMYVDIIWKFIREFNAPHNLYWWITFLVLKNPIFWREE